LEEINKGALDKPLRPQKKRKKYIGDSASEMGSWVGRIEGSSEMVAEGNSPIYQFTV